MDREMEIDRKKKIDEGKDMNEEKHKIEDILKILSGEAMRCPECSSYNVKVIEREDLRIEDVNDGKVKIMFYNMICNECGREGWYIGKGNDGKKNRVL